MARATSTPSAIMAIKIIRLIQYSFFIYGREDTKNAEPKAKSKKYLSCRSALAWFSGLWLCDYAEIRQPFDEIKHRHTLNEVGDVAEGKYDWKIKKGKVLIRIG